jgi:enhancing lycopene biosynthesis protein 2
MIKVGMILSGCGVQDGSEIYEAVLTVLALEKAGAQILALAPDIEQAQVLNHYTGQETRMETRNVLTEAARIVRGKIESTMAISAHDLDALILVGGYGAAKNLSTFANDGAKATVNQDVARLVAEMHGLGKPIGAMCIAPVVVALALQGSENVSTPILTIGSDEGTAAALEAIGAKHQVVAADQICIDTTNKIVSTPAFMLAETPGQAEPGITKMVNQVVAYAREINATYQGA